jgi:hypothetical protein
VTREKIKYQKSKCKIVESACGGASILYGRTPLIHPEPDCPQNQLIFTLRLFTL